MFGLNVCMNICICICLYIYIYMYECIYVYSNYCNLKMP